MRLGLKARTDPAVGRNVSANQREGRQLRRAEDGQRETPRRAADDLVRFLREHKARSRFSTETDFVLAVEAGDSVRSTGGGELAARRFPHPCL